MESKLTNKESLAIISEMIAQAKGNYTNRGSFYFLLWGWIIAVANFGYFIMDKYHLFDQPAMIWMITIPAGVASAIYSIKMKKEAIVVSHMSRLYGNVWIAVGIGIVLSLVFMSELNFNHSAIILLLAGIGTYISGHMLKFSALIFGAIALWLASLICFFLPHTDQYLVAGIGIVLGYLIPGYLLKKAE